MPATPPPKTDDEAEEKESRLDVRLPSNLKKKAEKKAKERGWTLASVVRSLLELWTEEDVVDPADVGKAAQRSKKKKK